jgi:retron-type reverse transcriptase
LRRALATPHLPQGAPSSPHLANLCVQRLDRRLAGYAAAAGAVYTRYADDLTFSGGTEVRRATGRLLAAVQTIVREEGLAVNAAKTRVRGRGSRQTVTGIVVNERPNVPRPEYDALKAQLFNAVRSGPSPQDLAAHPDLRAHLTGRVAWVTQLNPARGRRLQTLLDQVDWPTER